MHPIDVLALDTLLIGYVASRRWDILGRSPGPMNVGKPLAIIAHGQDSGLPFAFYPTMITWRPAIFGGYVELNNEDFFESPVSLKKASQIGLERGVWTFIKKNNAYRVVTLTKDFSKLHGKFDQKGVDQICSIEGKDLLQLSSVATMRESRRCICFDISVCLNSIDEALDSALSDMGRSEKSLKKGARASLQAVKKAELRRDFLSRSSEFCSKYPYLVEANDFEMDPQLEILEQEAQENRLFINLTRAVFANQFGIGEKYGTTGERLEEFLASRHLPMNAWDIMNLYDSIERKSSKDIKQAVECFSTLDKSEVNLESLILKTAKVATALFEKRALD